MKTKLIALAICSTLSTIAVAGGPHGHRGYLSPEVVLGTALILGVTGAIVSANRQPEIIVQQVPVLPQIEYVQPRLEPPTYDYSARVFIYKQPLAYDQRTGQWYRQSDVIVPESKHYRGCNYYDYFQAQRCIEWNEQYRR